MNNSCGLTPSDAWQGKLNVCFGSEAVVETNKNEKGVGVAKNVNSVLFPYLAPGGALSDSAIAAVDANTGIGFIDRLADEEAAPKVAASTQALGSVLESSCSSAGGLMAARAQSRGGCGCRVKK